MQVQTKPMRIPGSWKDGYVLDYHTKSSDFVGYDEYGHPQFSTVRTPVGDLLYRLKYKGEKEALADLVSIAVEFIRKWGPPVKAIVPVPPSRSRSTQPVMQIAQELAKLLRIPVRDVVRKAPIAREIKNVFDYHERLKLLEKAYSVTAIDLRGKAVLLVDDLYRSGATLNAVPILSPGRGKCARSMPSARPEPGARHERGIYRRVPTVVAAQCCDPWAARQHH